MHHFPSDVTAEETETHDPRLFMHIADPIKLHVLSSACSTVPRKRYDLRKAFWASNNISLANAIVPDAIVNLAHQSLPERSRCHRHHKDFDFALNGNQPHFSIFSGQSRATWNGWEILLSGEETLIQAIGSDGTRTFMCHRDQPSRDYGWSGEWSSRPRVHCCQRVWDQRNRRLWCRTLD